MATEILRPQDCLIQRIKVSPCRRRNFHYHGNGNGNAKYDSSNSGSSSNISSSSSSSSSNPRSNRKPVPAGQRSADHQRKRHQPEPSISKNSRSTSADDLRNHHQRQSQNQIHHGHSQSLVMDKVTILRRGESLDSRSIAETSSSSVANGTERIGPCPEAVPRQIRMTDSRPPAPPLAARGSRKCDVYAGSAFAVSPAPSALPLPSFSKKKQVSVDDSATRDLRRLLRLDL